MDSSATVEENSMEESTEKGWLCLECGVDMGPGNPRQLCGKWRCLSPPDVAARQARSYEWTSDRIRQNLVELAQSDDIPVTSETIDVCAKILQQLQSQYPIFQICAIFYEDDGEIEVRVPNVIIFFRDATIELYFCNREDKTICRKCTTETFAHVFDEIVGSSCGTIY